MAFSDNIYRLRKAEGLCEKDFASLFYDIVGYVVLKGVQVSAS